MTAQLVIACLAAALLSGGSGYFLSRRFYRSNYAATDKSGDFGTARGSFFAVMSGALIGIFTVSLATHIPAIPPEVFGPAFIVSFVVGGVAGRHRYDSRLAQAQLVVNRKRHSNRCLSQKHLLLLPKRRMPC